MGEVLGKKEVEGNKKKNDFMEKANKYSLDIFLTWRFQMRTVCVSKILGKFTFT